MKIVKFIYAKNKSDFENKINQISQDSVVFIEDTKQIWTHGQYYAWSEKELQQLFGDKITNLENIIITDGNGDSYLSDDGTYHKISIDLSKYLKKSEAQDTYLTIDDAVNMFQEKGEYLTSLPIANGSTLGTVMSGEDVSITNGIISINDNSHNHTVNNITNLQTLLDEKVPATRKINGKSLISDITLTAADIKAENYGASDAMLAVAKKYTDDSIATLVGTAPEVMDTIYELAEVIESNYSILDTLNKAVSAKVDKEEGKGLSTNDYTDLDKLKVEGIKENAEENQNAFSNILVNNGQQLIAAESKTDNFSLIAGKNITLGVNGKNITISGQANSVVNGDPTLSWGAKSVVGSIDDIALTVTMPSNPNTHYTTGIRAGASGTASNNSENNPYIKILDNSTYKSQIRLVGSEGTTVSSDDSGEITIWSKSYKPVTYTEDGLMSKEDKYKLDYIEDGAQVNTVLGVKGDNEITYRVGKINITKDNIGLGAVDNTSDANKPISNATQTALDKKAPTNHASTANTYGLGTITNYGHVKISNGDADTVGTADGLAAGMDHTHSKLAPLASPALTGTPTAPTANAGTNTTQIATTAFVQKEISDKIAASDAMIYKGTIGTNGTVSMLPAKHSTGWTYKVITAGTYAGISCEVGDMIICLTDGDSANNGHWTVIQNNIDGAVTGPTSSVNNRVVTFNGTSGKVIKDSGYTINASVPEGALFTDTTYTNGTGINLSNQVFSHADTSTLNGSYGPTANVTGNEGNTIVVPQITVDGFGHVTGVTNRTYTSKNTTYSDATTSSSGLMSADDKKKLNNITASASNVTFTPAYTSGTKIGTITINGVSTDIYIPIWSGTLSQYNALTKQNDFIYNIIE